MASFVPKNDTQLISFLDKLELEAKKWRQKWTQNWRADIANARGDQWGDSNEPMFLANLISVIVDKKQALLAESKPQIDIKVRGPGLIQTCQILNSTVGALWDELKIPSAFEEGAAFLEVLGHFYWKIGWDPQANYGNGDIFIKTIDPRKLSIDPNIANSYDLDKAQYIIEEDIKPFSWLVKHYPEAAKHVEPGANLALAGEDTQKPKGFFRRWIFDHGNANDSAIPLVYLRRYSIADPDTDEEGKPLYPNGRVMIRTGDDVIINPGVQAQQNPYFDGLWPYEMLDSRSDLDHPFGQSEVDKLIRLQEAFNRIGNQFVRNLIKNVDWIIADAAALTPDDIIRLKQLEQVVLEKGTGRELRREPATMPSAVEMQFLQSIPNLMEMMAGVKDDPMGGAKGRVELRSAPQLEGLQQAAQLLVRAQARRLEEFFERVGQKLISRIFQFYTNDRVLTYCKAGEIKQYQFEKDKLRAEIEYKAIEMAKAKIARMQEDGTSPGEEGETALTGEDILLAIKGAWRKFSFRVIPYSSLSIVKTQRATLLMELAQAGMLPNEMVLREAGFDNASELLQAKVQEMQQMQALGIPPPQQQQKSKKGKK